MWQNLKRIPTIACVALLASALPARAEDKLPTADDVLARYVEVTGGEAQYKSKNSRVSESTMEIPGMPSAMKITTYQQRPNHMRAKFESDALGRIEQGVNGDVAWSIHPMMGNTISEGKERAFVMRQADFDRETNWKAQYPERKMNGVTELEGKKYYELELTPGEGNPETRFYDVETGLLHRLEVAQPTAHGEIPTALNFGDYREVDGLKIPFEISMSMMGMSQTIKTTKVEFNTEIPEDTFAMPDAIRKLLEDKQAKAKLTDEGKPDEQKEKADDNN